MNERGRRHSNKPGHTVPTSSRPGHLTPMQEMQLVDAWHQGDAEALRTLLDSYQRRIFTICYRMLHHVDDAEDLTQDVLIKVFESLGSYDRRSKLSTWIIRIAINACVSHMRKAQVHKASSLHSGPGPFPGAEGLRLSIADTTEPTAGSRVEQVETRRNVIVALNRLEPEVRALLVLRDVQDLDYEQISQVLDVPVGTVKSRLFRARAALREEMDRQVGDGPTGGDER